MIDDYIVSVSGSDCSFYNMRMTPKMLKSRYLEMTCPRDLYFSADDSLLCSYVDSFNELFDNLLIENGYVDFLIEADVEIIVSPENLKSLNKDYMRVSLRNCRLLECYDKSGNAHNVEGTVFANKFNEHFEFMIDDYESASNFRVTDIRKE